jgi:hypothetical protein
VTITDDNFRGLSRLCEEFRFRDLAERLSQYRESDDLKKDGMLQDLKARKRLLALEERMEHHDHEIAVLRIELSRHSRAQESSSGVLLGRVARLEAEVSALRTAETELEADVRSLKADSPAQSTMIATLERLQFTVRTLKEYTGALPSLIVWDFPEIFAEFRGKRFSLLWRGSRDGFEAKQFHRRCDGHPNTLTVILDTKGNIFGGFTPVEWLSGDEHSKADPSQKSFLFTLRNPHNVPARRFPLKADTGACYDRIWAICGNFSSGPHFWDMAVFDDSKEKTHIFISRGCTGYFGLFYTNDTGLEGATLLTGSQRFKVKEIEVFEIIS